MKKAKPLYFLAVVPPEPVLTEVYAFKEIAATRFESRRALRSPAHVTLVPPFRIDEQEHRALLKAMHARLKHQPVFALTLSGFAAFRPRVIFVDVVPSPPLDQLYREAWSVMSATLGASMPARPFHPHMTVAFKDLRRARFAEAWRYFSEIAYDRTFDVDHLVLFRHEPSGWETDVVIPFGADRS